MKLKCRKHESLYTQSQTTTNPEIRCRNGFHHVLHPATLRMPSSIRATLRPKLATRQRHLLGLRSAPAIWVCCPRSSQPADISGRCLFREGDGWDSANQQPPWWSALNSLAQSSLRNLEPSRPGSHSSKSGKTYPALL